MTGDNPTSTELVKAAAEGAAGGTIAALIEPVSAFLGTLFGPATDQLGGWAGEFVAFKRWKSRVKMLTESKAIIEAAGLTAHEVPPRVLLPILDSGANEDGPEMQERWANLLANAATMSDPMSVALPEILKQLEAIEARALDFLVNEGRDWHGNAERVREHIVGLEEANVDNLVRLGLARFTGQNAALFGGVGPGRLTSMTAGVHVTALGLRLVVACRAPAAALAA